MGCNTIALKNIERDCEPNQGGIKALWLSTFSANMFTVESDTASTDYMKVTAVTTGSSWAKYEFNANTGSFTSTLNKDQAAGTNFIETAVNLQFNRMETKKRIGIVAISKAECCGIIQDANNAYWAIGFDEPVINDGGSGNSGTNRTDANNYLVSLKDYSLDYPYEVLKSVVDNLTTINN